MGGITRRIVGALLGAVIGLVASAANAFDPYPDFTFAPGAGNTITTTATGGTASAWKTGHGTPISTGMQYESAAKELPFKPSTTAKFRMVFTPQNIGKALTAGAAVAIPLVLTPAISALLNQACIRAFGGAMQLSPGGQWEECHFSTQTLQGFRAIGDPNSLSASRQQSCDLGMQHGVNRAYMAGNYNALGAYTGDPFQVPCFVYTSSGEYWTSFSVEKYGTVEQQYQDGWQPATAQRAEDAIDSTLSNWAQTDFARGDYSNLNNLQKVLDDLYAQGQSVEGQFRVPQVQTPVMEPPVNVVQADSAGNKYEESTQTKNDYTCTVIEDGKAVQCSQSKTITKTGTTTTVDPSNPNATPTTSTSTTTTTKTGDPSEADPCKANPNRVGCVELGDPTGQIPKRDVAIGYTPESVLGSGGCPADKTMTVAGRTIKAWDWQQSCSYIVSYVKPVVLAVSAFIALMIVLPGVKVE